MPMLKSLARQLSGWPARVISVSIAVIAAIWLGLGLTLSGAQAVTSSPAPQTANTPADAIAQVEVPDPQQFRSLEQDDSSLSLLRAEELLGQAQAATEAQDFDRAISLLEEAFEAFNQRSNFYQSLSRSFAGIDNRLSDSLREQAREAAQFRDQTSFELAVVYRAAEQPEAAVSQLVQVISSQGPTRELGANAYNQLFELGFVDTPYES